MHFVFLNQYYPPDVAPTGVMLDGVVDGLVRDGHDVTVICAKGGYAGGNEVISDQLSVISEENASETAKAPRILRVGATRFGRGSFVGKLADYFSYYVGVAWRLAILHPRPDRIVALTTPPYLSVLARLMSKLRGADHAHWVMDLYPDVLAAHGMASERSLMYRILAGLARWGLGGNRCAAVLTLGPDMAERVGNHLSGGRRENSVKWVPLWGSGGEVVSDQWSVISERQTAPEPSTFNCLRLSPKRFDSQLSTSSTALRRQRNWADDELVVMYSGNMGLGHRFGEVLAAARDLAGFPETDHDGESRIVWGGFPSAPVGGRVRFVFFGGGKRRSEVEEFLGSNPGCHVELHDYAPAEILAEHLRSADVHLASLDDEWTGTMVPSKLQGIFEAGRPVIFIGNPESSIGSWVTQSGGGWVVKPGDVAGLHDAISEARNPRLLMIRGVAARVFAESHFNKAVNIARVIAALAS